MATISKKSGSIGNVKVKLSPGKKRSSNRNNKRKHRLREAALLGLCAALVCAFLYVVLVKQSPGLSILKEQTRDVSRAPNRTLELEITTLQDAIIFRKENENYRVELEGIDVEKERIAGAWLNSQEKRIIVALEQVASEAQKSFTLVSFSESGFDPKFIERVVGESIGDLTFSPDNRFMSYRVGRKENSCGETYELFVFDTVNDEYVYLVNDAFEYEAQVEGGKNVITRMSEYDWAGSDRILFYNRPVVCLKNGKKEPLHEKQYLWNIGTNTIFEVLNVSTVVL